MNFQEALTKLTQLVKSYPVIRKTGSLEEIQTLRDEINECIFHFGDTYAEIRSQTEWAEMKFKMCVDEKKLIRRKEYNNKNVGLADIEAALDCREKQEELLQKNNDFYRAKILIESSENISNTISSRLKLNSRHE